MPEKLSRLFKDFLKSMSPFISNTTDYLSSFNTYLKKIIPGNVDILKELKDSVSYIGIEVENILDYAFFYIDELFNTK